MAKLEEDLKTFLSIAENRKQLSPEELARLEALVKELENTTAVQFHNPDKFDAKDMHPVGKGPVNWKKPRR
jgi:hypothetical protein